MHRKHFTIVQFTLYTSHIKNVQIAHRYGVTIRTIDKEAEYINMRLLLSQSSAARAGATQSAQDGAKMVSVMSSTLSSCAQVQ